MSDTAAEEDKLLDAEAWADELDAWSKSRRGTPEASETSALSRLIRALVKSIRLSIVADGDEEDRRYLMEELDSTVAQAHTVAMGSAPKRTEVTGGSLPPTLMRQQAVDLPMTKPAREQRISDLALPAVRARPTKREED